MSWKIIWTHTSSSGKTSFPLIYKNSSVIKCIACPFHRNLSSHWPWLPIILCIRQLPQPFQFILWWCCKVLGGWFQGDLSFAVSLHPASDWLHGKTDGEKLLWFHACPWDKCGLPNFTRFMQSRQLTALLSLEIQTSCVGPGSSCHLQSSHTSQVVQMLLMRWKREAYFKVLGKKHLAVINTLAITNICVCGCHYL